MIIDTHAHIYDTKILAQLDLIMKNAIENNVLWTFMPNVDLDTVERMHEVEDRYPQNTKSMMGLHPCSVGLDWKEVLINLSKNFVKRTYVGIGETGIDLYWDTKYYEEQRKAFNWQIDMAKEMKLPIIIHSRSSIDICIEMIRERQDGDLKGIFHCFSGDNTQAQHIKDLNFYIGIGGVVTYKNSKLNEVLGVNGFDNVVLETDSPYLAPVPNRGKNNEPSYLKFILEKISLELNIEKIILSQKTTENALKLFGLAP
ncbi:MAG TPA: TatD family hydrolase [Saprospiraceae bacterium]|nr:TatD family hydrolase [Saprospiraceae bacterium]